MPLTSQPLPRLSSNTFSNLFAGFISGLMTIIAAISYATLVFSGSSADFLHLGIASALTCSLAVGLIAAFRSSSPVTIAGPDANISAILALIVAAVTTKAVETGKGEGLFTMLWVTLALSTFLTGIFLYLVGRFRMGRWIRFIPYPVIGGFLAGTGWLLARGSFKVMCGIPLSLNTIACLFENEAVLHWLPGTFFAIALLVVLRRWSHFLIMPSILIGAIILAHGVLAAAGISVRSAMDQGWLLSPFSSDLFFRSFRSLSFSGIDLTALGAGLPNVGSLMLVSAIVILLNAASVELATRKDVELDRELTTTGLANAIAAPFGAMAGCMALSRTILNFKAGASGRVSGITSALICGLVLFAAAPALAFFPRPVLGGLLLYLGLSLLAEWVWDGWKRLSRLDYALVVAIIIIVALWGFLAGVGIGLVVACILFALNYSRTGAIKQTFTGMTCRSNRDRAFSEQQVLDADGHRIYVVRLQGYLFFGTSYPLLMHVRQKLDEIEPRFVILDFLSVTRIDSSAVMSISKLLQSAGAKKTEIIAVNLKNDVEELLFESGCLSRPEGSRKEGRAIFFTDLDHALEWCEELLIESSGVKKKETSNGFSDHFLHFFEKPEMIPRFLERLERVVAPAGFVLFEKGTPGTDLYFVETGEVTASIEMLGGGEKRLRTMGEGTVVGEMGLYLGIPRSATVKVERPAVLYKLSRETLAGIEKEDPELANTLHRFFIKHLAYRLMHANEEMALAGK